MSNDTEQPEKYLDKVVTCAGCGQTFTWSADEQEFYDRRGFYAPRRCRPCREARKAERAAGNVRVVATPTVDRDH